MAIVKSTPTPANTPKATIDLIGMYQKTDHEAQRYTRKVPVNLTPAQYAELIGEADRRGYPRHGGTSKLVREALAAYLGFEP